MLNTTIQANHNNLALSVLVVYEPEYTGGAGIGHGGVDDLLLFLKEEIAEDSDDNAISRNDATEDVDNAHVPSLRGRYLVILSDHCGSQETSPATTSSSCSALSAMVSILDTPPLQVRLPSLAENNNKATVCGPLYRLAGRLLEALGPILLQGQDHATTESSGGDSSDVEEEGDQVVESDVANNSPSLPAIPFVGYSLAGKDGELSAPSDSTA